MQISTISAIKDTAARAFMQPFFTPNAAVAQRSFADALLQPESDLARHPSDFELYEIGAFDASTGVLTTLSEPRLIIRAKDIVSPVSDVSDGLISRPLRSAKS